MPTPAARGLTVGALLLGVSLLSLALGTPADAPVKTPDAGALVSGTGWQVRTVEPVSRGNTAYQQVSVHSAGGVEALLYLGATRRPQAMLAWTPELGFVGAGYLVQSSGMESVPTAAGVVEAARLWLARGGDQLDVLSVVLRPDGAFAHGSDSPLGLGWNALAHRGAVYYEVRVAVPVYPGVDTARAASEVLATALGRLRAGKA